MLKITNYKIIITNNKNKMNRLTFNQEEEQILRDLILNCNDKKLLSNFTTQRLIKKLNSNTNNN
jgi:hypothetical protein